MKDLTNDYVAGLSILGGDPMMPQNFDTVLQLCIRIKTEQPTKTIWLWTGRVVEDLEELGYSQILNWVDVIVDGPFIEALADTELQYRGSSNQRVIRL